MALSVVNFRMKQSSKVAPAAEKVEQVLFSGNGIKLIDLKKEIAEKKKFSNNLDYDLTVTDENGKGNMRLMLHIITPHNIVSVTVQFVCMYVCIYVYMYVCK
jgi:hypothetical protein